MTNIFVSIPLPELLLGINSILYHRIPNMLTMPDIVCTEQISAALLTKWVRERNPLEMICLEAYAIDLKKNGKKIKQNVITKYFLEKSDIRQDK